MLTDKELQEKRMNICVSCENFFPTLQQCKICKCIMPMKTRLRRAECPVGKWEVLNKGEGDNGQLPVYHYGYKQVKQNQQHIFDDFNK